MILKHRDRELLRFEWIEPQGVRVVSVNDAERKFLPLEMKGVASDETLWTWLTRRTVPRNRRNIEELMARLGLNSRNIKGIIELCRGLSLNDVYWVAADDFHGKWAEVNLYNNSFSEAIALMAFGGEGPDFQGRWTSSPELTTNDKNEIVGAAPIFDNGYGLFSLALDRVGDTHDEFDDLRRFTSRVNPALYLKWLGFPGGVTSSMKKRLEALKGYRIKRHPKYNLSARRISAIEDFLQNRIAKIAEYGEKADEFIAISQKECTVNRVSGAEGCTLNSDSLELQIKQNMRADPFITKMELAELLQVSPRWIARKMKELQATGEIRRVGADKNGWWDVLK